MPKSIQIFNTKIKIMSAREKDGASPSFPFFAFYDDFFRCFKKNAFSIVLLHVCSVVCILKFSIIHKKLASSCCSLTEWDHLNASTNKQPQPIHFFSSFFHWISYFHTLSIFFLFALRAFACFVFHFVFSTFTLWRDDAVFGSCFFSL